MKYLPDDGWQRILVAAAYFIISAVSLWIILRYALGLFMPFVIAWLIALAVGPLIKIVNKKTKLPRKMLAAVFVIGVIALAGGALFFVGERIISELTALLETLTQNADTYISSARDWLKSFAGKIPFIDDIGNSADSSGYIIDTAADIIKSTVSAISAKLPEIIGAILVRLPDAVFFTVILIMGSFYICADFSAVNAKIISLMPQFIKKSMGKLKSNVRTTGIKYLRAYFIMMCVTFAELLTGFLILGIDYSFTIALVSAMVDILPVFGVGIILIPWALFMFMRGDFYTAFGLLITYGTVTLIRQIIEPKIIGANIGLPPLATLVAMYAGYKTVGIFGMIIFPVAATVIKNLIKKDDENNEQGKESPVSD